MAHAVGLSSRCLRLLVHTFLTRVRHAAYTFRWPIVCWIVVFWRLGYPSLLDPDEAHYAELTREMLRARNWMVPMLDGAPFIDKPVFFHWLQGVCVMVLGESELALRLPNAFAALGLFWATSWLGRELFHGSAGNAVRPGDEDERGSGSARTGDWGAMMFATIPATFLLSSVGLFDMLFSAFLFGGLSCLLVSAIRTRPRLEFAGWLLITLAVMTKGPVALVLLAAFFGACLLRADTRRVVVSLHVVGGFTVVVVAASPWFIWMWLHFNAEFIKGYVLSGNLYYLTQPASFPSRASSPAFYLRTFSTAFFPWSVVLTGYAADVVRRWRRGDVGEPRLTAESLLWVWVLVVIGFFSIAGFKLDTYIFPAAPACCLLAARGWERASTGDAWLWTRRAIVGVGALFLVAGIVGGLTLFQLNLGVDWTALSIPMALVGGGSAMVWMMKHNGWRPPDPQRVPIITLLALYAALVIVGYPALERSRPTAPLGRWIRENIPPDFRVGTYGVLEWWPSLRYYSDRFLDDLPTSDAAQAFLRTAPRRFVIMLGKDYRAFQEQGVDLTVVQRFRMIAGRSQTYTYIRPQIWDDIVVVGDGSVRIAASSP